MITGYHMKKQCRIFVLSINQKSAADYNRRAKIMRTIRIKAYKFEELNEDAKQNARNWWIDGGSDYEWWDSIYDDAKEIGLKITGFDLDRNRYAKGEFLLSACEVAQNILNNHGETCETYKTAKGFLEDWQLVFNEYMDENSERYESYDAEQEMQELEDDFLSSLLEDYSIMLQNEYEYMLSDEYIDEMLTINEYEFTKEGERI